jgi:hypothetical protein
VDLGTCNAQRRWRTTALMRVLLHSRAMDAGSEDIWDLRSTDIDENKCRRRYEVFKQHYSTLLRLKQVRTVFRERSGSGALRL